ncbi:MAG: hypothetical protein Q8M09_04610, partial [Pseudomonadota bacterium]|nr:hypothetical protein [Pseudomonadota bacterium]MDP2354097.1 hypothetical protein [Pseudomonadota bacterium]
MSITESAVKAGIGNVLDFFIRPSWWWDFPQLAIRSGDAGHCSDSFSCNPNYIDDHYYNPLDKKWYKEIELKQNTSGHATADKYNWINPASQNIQDKLTKYRASTLEHRDNFSPIKPIKQSINKASTLSSPIILDLDGDGVETTAATAGAYFDHAGDGFAERSGWVGGGDGLLV